jgi:hypothetical protein
VKLPRGASGCAALEQSATQAKADKKERESGGPAPRPRTASSTSRNSLAAPQVGPVWSRPRVFTVNFPALKAYEPERRTEGETLLNDCYGSDKQ